jgi:hypothetical protein
MANLAVGAETNLSVLLEALESSAVAAVDTVRHTPRGLLHAAAGPVAAAHERAQRRQSAGQRRQQRTPSLWNLSHCERLNFLSRFLTMERLFTGITICPTAWNGCGSPVVSAVGGLGLRSPQHTLPWFLLFFLANSRRRAVCVARAHLGGGAGRETTTERESRKGKKAPEKKAKARDHEE